MEFSYFSIQYTYLSIFDKKTHKKIIMKHQICVINKSMPHKHFEKMILFLMSLNFYFEKMCWKNKLTWQRACMVPYKPVHSGKLLLEHERAYARLLGNTEYCLACQLSTSRSLLLQRLQTAECSCKTKPELPAHRLNAITLYQHYKTSTYIFCFR